MASLFGNIKKAVKKGAKGGDVKKIQKELAKRMKVNIKPDGEFGPATEKLIKDFQKKNKLKVDGVLGPKSLGMLEGMANGAAGAAKGVSDKLAKFNGQTVIFKVMRESIKEQNKDLKYWRQQLKALQDVLGTVKDDSELAQYDLQNLTTKMNQYQNMMSSVMRKFDKAANTIIRNI